MKISAKKVTRAIAALSISMLAIMLLLQYAAPAAAQSECEALYKAKCAMCHGADGSGSTAMGKKLNVRDLRSAVVQKMSDKELYAVIAHGKNKMPSYQNTLGRDKIEQLVAHTRGLAQKH